MGHSWHISYLKAKTDEDALREGLEEAKEFAYYEGDRYEGTDVYSNSFKLYNKKFEYESDAIDFFDSLGAYVDGIVLVKHPSDAMARNYDKRKKALKIKEETIKMKAKEVFKTRKSKTISCKHCECSMTNEQALRNQLRCTNCRKYLYSNGVLDKLEKISEALQALEKKYKQDIADNGKYKYFMKAEIHC